MTDSARINFKDAAGDPVAGAPWDYNALSSATATGIVIANILNDSGDETVWSLNITAAFGSNEYISTAATADSDTTPFEVLNNWFRTPINGTSIIEIGNLDTSKKYTLLADANTNQLNRHTNFTVGSESLDYLVSSDPATPTDAVEFDSISPDSNGIIALEITKASTGQYYGHINDLVIIEESSDSTDITPAIFSFTDITNEPRSTTVESEAITVLEVTDETNIPVSVTGGEYAISTDGGTTWGSFTSTAGTVELNDQVKVQHTTSSAYETSVDTELTIGGVTDTFSSTTETEPVSTVEGITSLTGTVVAGGSFQINLSNVDELEANEDWHAFLTVNSTQYTLEVSSQTATAVVVIAPDNLPDSTPTLLTLQRRQISA